ncbi:type II secretion system protein GspE [Lottiidibacillus patelloidae]|uniref:Type II secretion system protein GspE n=1 Tax=Lottiidibacillus patelloidae TaxID=2670334 RepID=A0A263BWB1_9BACI|nr:ATPase, T2SS/T4P/T4SS family [Lottiidibacillus patelloidae]OZM57868.1 type II secretion system protein GspE [Lottiidibacillus patelloidae]
MSKTRKRLGDLLIESGLITEKQLSETLDLKAEGQKLGDALIERGLISEQQLTEALHHQLNIPQVSLFQYPINENILALVSKEFAKRNLIMPFKKEGQKLHVAMADPMDYYSIDDLRLSTGFQIEPAIATKDDISRAITKYYAMDDSIDELFEDMPEEQPDEGEEIDVNDSPVVRIVNQILTSAVEQKASDIHFDPQERHLAVRFRVDGILQTEKKLPKHMQNVITARIKIMANLNITESRIPQDGRIKLTIDIHPVDLRVSTLPTVFGEKIVLRILDLSNALNDIDKLGFNKINYNRFIELIERPTGIILITGPTGSGKTSTLYAGLNHLNSEDVNIITVEDPVEYQIQGINQIQVNANVGMTFAKGLRAILRQDPNIVMVGEIRDQETAEIAIRASLTGHLVLSTIHTNDSISTLSRLVDMGLEPFMVASSIAGVISQRLVRRICKDCAVEQEASRREQEIFAKRGLKIETVMRGTGCGNCNMSGYRGRIAIHEVLVMNEEIRNLLLNNRPVSEIHELTKKLGMIYLTDDGLLKVKQGHTTTEEVLRVALSE